MTNPMTPERIEEIENMFSKISQGVWWHYQTNNSVVCDHKDVIWGRKTIADVCNFDNAKFIANAPVFVKELLAALEESRQQVKDLKEDKRKILAVHDEQCARSSEYYNELIFVKGKLAEAQQTIARQREVLEFYANQEHWELPSFGRGQSKVTSDRGSKARELLEEGSDKA
ncbi:hypothetical protein BSK66_15780 [Paenibacillus odorifer]|uniref:Uncharacterized protein n=1 Tax=Paenibacillus odorifer TaxID=189426 RepID=A0A1R0X041_9BACL|nr:MULTISPECIES: hypothetical protein [Paenibacillus]ETT55216.1 hypothetical protein C171_19552 [Paenibacillus sp. FSL H8-237]OMD25446.1 hypothetical protein BJP51_04145 [Paenibacillus odorifer]OME56311.1 hypothetical protein BSK66_15780 [Paenibacillus odorifer]